MSKRSPQLLLEDIVEAVEKIEKYLSEYNFEKFVDDSKTIDAVIRNFEIIGKAANRLPVDFRDANENVQWFKIIGFRNRIIHDYMGVDLSIVWNIYQDFLPKLKSDINQILNSI